MNQEEQQQKALEFQILNSQFEQAKEQLQKFQQQKESMENLLLSLNEISGLKKKESFLSPLSSGVLVKTSLEEPDSVFITVGAGVIVKKKLNEAKKTIEGQKKQLTLIISQLESRLSQIGNVLNQLQQELQ